MSTNWKENHNLEFDDDAEHDQRFQEFKETHDLIEEHNNGNPSYELEHNLFSHMVLQSNIQN